MGKGCRQLEINKYLRSTWAFIQTKSIICVTCNCSGAFLRNLSASNACFKVYISIRSIQEMDGWGWPCHCSHPIAFLWDTCHSRKRQYLLTSKPMSDSQTLYVAYTTPHYKSEFLLFFFSPRSRYARILSSGPKLWGPPPKEDFPKQQQEPSYPIKIQLRYSLWKWALLIWSLRLRSELMFGWSRRQVSPRISKQYINS